MFSKILPNAYYQGPKTDHFDGRIFFNAHAEKRNFKDLLRWRMSHKPSIWPIHREIIPQKIKDERVDKGISITFINHSTALIQIDGLNILTDPIWSERCSPFKRMGPRRVHAPGVKFHDLPPIDVVLLSHNHYDHCDLLTLHQLYVRDRPLFLTGLGNAAVLHKKKINNVCELDWWQSAAVEEKAIIHYTPAQHFSSRFLWDRDWALWGGFCLKTPDKLIYFAGDTGYATFFKEIKERIGTPDVALLPIGAYEPRWFMRPAHMNPEEALQAHVDLGAKKSMGIHFGTFQLTDEGVDDPPNKIRALQAQFGLKDDDFWLPQPGETKVFL